MQPPHKGKAESSKTGFPPPPKFASCIMFISADGMVCRIKIISSFVSFMIVYVHECMCLCTFVHLYVRVRGQFSGVGSLLPPYRGISLAVSVVLHNTGWLAHKFAGVCLPPTCLTIGTGITDALQHIRLLHVSSGDQTQILQFSAASTFTQWSHSHWPKPYYFS